MSQWSRDECLASHSKDSTTASISGSKSGTHYTKNNFLGVNIPHGNLDSNASSPAPSPRRAQSRPPSAAYGLAGRLSSPNRSRSPGGTPNSSSSMRSTPRSVSRSDSPPRAARRPGRVIQFALHHGATANPLPTMHLQPRNRLLVYIRFPMHPSSPHTQMVTLSTFRTPTPQPHPLRHRHLAR